MWLHFHEGDPAFYDFQLDLPHVKRCFSFFNGTEMGKSLKKLAQLVNFLGAFICCALSHLSFSLTHLFQLFLQEQEDHHHHLIVSLPH